MGGKTKQSQRTKNNVRPSSSSRSAELLNNSLNLEGGLITINSGKVMPSLFPSLVVNIDQSLSPEFQICIKKLNKKDPITRVKALQELCELVNNGNVDDVVAFLPTWAHFYKTLTADMDRKVREMTQMCQGAVVRVCGRRTAPQLRALLPAWLQAQYDEHAPAMTHAQNSLRSTFPDAKLPEVISFCKAEVIAHFVDNLIGNTEAVINKNTESAEERSLQLGRVASGSLRGLELFVRSLPAPQHAWLWGALAPLLEAGAFWKFAAHNMHTVRAAWYGAVGRIVERFETQFADAYGLRLVRVLVAAARDSHVWACLLRVMRHVQDWQKYLDKKELLVKRILDVLETGGWGDAKNLSTMLLPLLAHLPQDILTKQFYELFFNAIYKGLEQKNIITSKSERQSWITSLAECLRYLSIQQHDFVVEVVTSVHRTWLEKALCTKHDVQTRNNLIRCSASNMTSLVKYWLKQSKEGNSEKYDQLLRNFWQNIGSTVLMQIDKCSTNITEIETLIDGHILLLQTLKTSFLQETKKQLSIRFEKSEVDDIVEETPSVIQVCDVSVIERYNHNLNEVVHRIISHYFETAQKKQVPNAILSHLVTLLMEFESEATYVSVARAFGVHTPLQLYDSVFRSWLAGDTMRCEPLVDIVFLMMKFLNDEEQDAVFDSFKQLAAGAAEWCLARAVSHPHCGRRAAREWARSAAARGALAALGARATRRDAAAARLLLAALADGPHGEPLISEAGVTQVITIVTEALAIAVTEAEAGTETKVATDAVAEAAAEGMQVEWSGRLAARLVTALAGGPHRSEPFATLVFNLFSLNMLVQRGAGETRVGADTWGELLGSWQDGLGALAPAARRAFCRRAGELVHRQLFQRIDNLDVEKLEHIVSLTPYLFTRGGDDKLPEDITEIVTFTKQIFDIDTTESLAIETCALRYECVTSQLNCLYDDNEAMKNVIDSSSEQNVKEFSKLDFTTYANKVLFRAIYLKTLLLHKVASEDEDESVQKTWCDALLSNNYIETEFCKVLHDYVIVYSLHEGYEFWPNYNIIDETNTKMAALLSDVIAATSEPLRHQIVDSLSDLASTSGYFWAYAHRFYVVNALSEEDAKLECDKEIKEAEITGNGYFHMLQAVHKFGGARSAQYAGAYAVLARSWLAAHGAPAPALAELARARPPHDVGVFVDDYYRRQRTMLYDTDISAAPWSCVVSNVAVLEFLALMVAQRGWDAPAHHWDFATISLCSLLTSACRSKRHWGSAKVAMLALAGLRLLAAARRFAAELPRECQRRAPAPHVAALGAEWRDIFAPDAYGSAFNLAAHVLESCESSSLTSAQAAVVSALAVALPTLDWHQAGQTRAPGDLALGDLARVGVTALLRPTHPALKYLTYNLLMNLAEALVFDDSQKLLAWSGEGGEAGEAEGEQARARPAMALDYFGAALAQLADVLGAALAGLQVGEEVCELASMSDSHSMALGYLLLADVQATICELAQGDLRQFYIQMCREAGQVPALLAAALRLLPAGAHAFALEHGDGAAAPQRYTNMFVQVEPFSMRLVCSSALVPALACRCVFTSVCGAGCGAARGWWGAAAARAARYLERLVAAYVAPPATARQLQLLQRRAREIDDAEIRIAWSAAEVVCEYSVEERALELHVQLSRAHPLRAPTLRAPALAGANTTHWLALYLAYQNGTILNALKMWTRVVNARLERAPQCYICYCRLQPASGQLPRVTCHQCSNKFHNLCLRKWFTTSNKSNCPLCRATF